MDYITLSNGIKMPQLGYGVYQVTKAEAEGAFRMRWKWATVPLTRRSRISTKKKWGMQLQNRALRATIFSLPQKSGLSITATRRARSWWKNRLRNSRLITLTSCFFISLLVMLTVHGALLKNFMKKEF